MIKDDVSVIIPVFNEAETIGSLVTRVKDLYPGFEIIVVDDGSSDSTAEAAREAGALVFQHPYNIGNGAAVKAGIRVASGDVLVFMDGDGQHSPEDIPRLLEKLDPYDMVVGARTSDSKSSFHRDLANSFYNLFASYICKRKIEDLTSGFRAIKADIARRFVSLLPNTFSYPTTITMAVVRGGYSLTYVPIKAKRRVGKSKIKLVRDGAGFLLIIIKIATLFSPLRIFLPVSVAMFLLGLSYGLFRILFMDGRYGPTSAMLMTMAVVVFMVGLVSEQITQLRYDRKEDRS